MRTKQRNNLAETARHERVAQNTDVYAVKARNYKGTEKLPFFLKWKFFFYIFSIFFLEKAQKSYGLLHSQLF